MVSKLPWECAAVQGRQPAVLSRRTPVERRARSQGVVHLRRLVDVEEMARLIRRLRRGGLIEREGDGSLRVDQGGLIGGEQPGAVRLSGPPMAKPGSTRLYVSSG